MAGPKSVDVCVNCGMPPCKVDPTLPITLLFSKATRQVLCLEAGKDFVDTLMGFLTLPVGCIVKLLEQASMIHRPECKIAPRPSTPLVFPPDCPYTPGPKKGKNDAGEHFAMSSISNVFESVVKLDSKEMSMDKMCLVDPKPAVPFGAGKLLNLNTAPTPSSENSAENVEAASYYCCGNACSLYSTSANTKCPKHKKKMSVPLKFVEGSAASGSDPGDDNSQVWTLLKASWHAW